MSFRSIVHDVKDGFGSLSCRSFDLRLPGLCKGRSHGAAIHEFHDLPPVIQNSCWSNLPPELLRDVIKRLETSESTWPARKHVACASVCRSWRKMCREIVLHSEFTGKITFPVSLKQPGPRDGMVQCFIKRDKSKMTHHLFLFLSPGRALFAKLSISQGMNPYVFVFYRQAFASLALAPFAYFFDRKKCDPLSLNLLCKIFFVSLVGVQTIDFIESACVHLNKFKVLSFLITRLSLYMLHVLFAFMITLSLNLDSVYMNYALATFTVAISNTVPAITFIMALVLSISITPRHGVAKVLGTIISLSGALIFVLIKGPPIYSVSKNQLISSPSTERVYTTEDWVKRSLTSISSNVVWSMWIIMQAPIVKQYPALLRLTAIPTFFSCIQLGVWAIIAEKNLSAWKLGWDINLLPVAYCGFLFTAITYWLRIWVIENKGPDFLAMFTHLALINTAILSALIWSEVLHWGSVGGGILLVGGLYWFLWGKQEETKANNANEDKQKPSTITTNNNEQEIV